MAMITPTIVPTLLEDATVADEGWVEFNAVWDVVAVPDAGVFADGVDVVVVCAAVVLLVLVSVVATVVVGVRLPVFVVPDAPGHDDS